LGQKDGGLGDPHVRKLLEVISVHRRAAGVVSLFVSSDDTPLGSSEPDQAGGEETRESTSRFRTR